MTLVLFIWRPLLAFPVSEYSPPIVIVVNGGLWGKGTKSSIHLSGWTVRRVVCPIVNMVCHRNASIPSPPRRSLPQFKKCVDYRGNFKTCAVISTCISMIVLKLPLGLWQFIIETFFLPHPYGALFCRNCIGRTQVKHLAISRINDSRQRGHRFKNK